MENQAGKVIVKFYKSKEISSKEAELDEAIKKVSTLTKELTDLIKSSYTVETNQL